MSDQSFLNMQNIFGVHSMHVFPQGYFLEMSAYVIAYTFFNQEVEYSVHTRQKYTAGFQVIGTACFLNCDIQILVQKRRFP